MNYCNGVGVIGNFILFLIFLYEGFVYILVYRLFFYKILFIVMAVIYIYEINIIIITVLLKKLPVYANFN